VAFESCWKIEFFDGGGVYQDTSSASTDCSNPTFSATPHSTFNPSKSTSNLAIYDIPNLGYDGELTLYEDATLAPDQIKAQMTEKLPNSPIFGTYGLTVTFQTCSTLSPTSVPSTLPSDTPSSKPSDTPSLHPSKAPSSEPSSAPSDGPSSLPSVSPTSTCPISEFIGRSFLFPLLDACFKMEIFDGGSIYVDENNGDCTNPKFDTSAPMSYYGGTEDGNKATFVTNGKPGKWSGELFVVQGDTDSTEVSDLDIGQKQFQVLQKMTKCVAAPSMSPSALPTDLPSYSSIPSMFPTRDPSESPSDRPSMTPSALPTNIHSSLPSLQPSPLHPNACPSGGFVGRTFKSVVFDECWTFESFSGGNINVDPTDSTCSATTPHSSTYVLGEYKENAANKFFFVTIPSTTDSASWEGYIEILEDTKLTQESLELTKLGWNTNKLVFTLSVPDCTSSEPSVKPSSMPSISSNPSSSPTRNPTPKPTPNPTPKPTPSPTAFCYPSGAKCGDDGWFSDDKEDCKYCCNKPGSSYKCSTSALFSSGFCCY
jgi:hypothetical protein